MGRFLIAIILMSFVFLGFQNCSEVQFTPAQSAALVEKRTTDSTGEDLVSGEVAQGDDLVSGDEGGEGEDDVGEGDEGEDGGEGEAEEVRGQYICILAGPGQSVRLGIIDGALLQNGRTPNTVCMSKSACEQIVSQKFSVKAAKRSGVCRNNPHVQHLNNAQLQTLVDAI
ncbi:MAG: hypothetical protein AB7N80_13100 [Bdellovibrionales bacterium]